MTTTRTSRARLTAAAVIAAVSALALTACGSGSSGTDAGAADGTAKERTVTDATGAKVTVPGAPKKVVVLSEMDLDSALTLGVTPVGLTAGRGQDGAPAYLAAKAKGIPLVGAVTGPDIEKVVAAEPDVILAGQISDSQVLKQLKAIAPTVITIDGTKSWKKALTVTGAVLNKSAAAKAFLGSYDQRVTAVRTAIGNRAGSTVSVARYSPKGTAVMQQGVFISDVLKDLAFQRPGLQNQQGEGHSTPLSAEDIGQIDADWLFIGTLTSTGQSAGGTGLIAKLSADAAFKSLGAITAKHATEIDGTQWTSLGGATAAMNVLDDVERAMKP
ncbi:ABC transporter substrate-binding protein [Streptomyces sp. H39-S7]|uniref:ABC transporter substrate-binding protein n=1 Tax=Streptomyces sp. H39-S7 TaxID=3004357 RepID=UPI0022AF666E|nr:iron-siderophore ABC transporter substrate-binding protein [Streptomyces sp. H39-S7]MCZ4123086.1 iron-siderophore ABC transporter substrate-binding protein [Streptomyces sp. H39-S7]